MKYVIFYDDYVDIPANRIRNISVVSDWSLDQIATQYFCSGPVESVAKSLLESQAHEDPAGIAVKDDAGAWHRYKVKVVTTVTATLEEVKP